MRIFVIAAAAVLLAGCSDNPCPTPSAWLIPHAYAKGGGGGHASGGGGHATGGGHAGEGMGGRTGAAEGRGISGHEESEPGSAIYPRGVYAAPHGQRSDCAQ